MEVEFLKSTLKRLACDASFLDKVPTIIVRKYRKLIVHLTAIESRASIRNWAGLKPEKLKGDKRGFYSVRLNKQWRVILKFKKDKKHDKVIIIKIEDYH